MRRLVRQTRRRPRRDRPEPGNFSFRSRIPSLPDNDLSILLARIDEASYSFDDGRTSPGSSSSITGG
jgi:hypothetical protein